MAFVLKTKRLAALIDLVASVWTRSMAFILQTTWAKTAASFARLRHVVLRLGPFGLGLHDIAELWPHYALAVLVFMMVFPRGTVRRELAVIRQTIVLHAADFWDDDIGQRVRNVWAVLIALALNAALFYGFACCWDALCGSQLQHPPSHPQQQSDQRQ